MVWVMVWAADVQFAHYSGFSFESQTLQGLRVQNAWHTYCRPWGSWTREGGPPVAGVSLLAVSLPGRALPGGRSPSWRCVHSPGIWCGPTVRRATVACLPVGAGVLASASSQARAPPCPLSGPGTGRALTAHLLTSSMRPSQPSDFPEYGLL